MHGIILEGHGPYGHYDDNTTIDDDEKTLISYICKIISNPIIIHGLERVSHYPASGGKDLGGNHRVPHLQCSFPASLGTPLNDRL